MNKEEICEKVRSICKEENVDFLFITEGKSCWSVSQDEHIRDVAYYHKENEEKEYNGGCISCNEVRAMAKHDKQVYNNAIDDFVRFANTMPTVEEEDGEIRPMWLEEIAEQLKVGANNDKSI